MIEVVPGEPLVETAPGTTTTVVTPGARIEADSIAEEPAGASRFRYETDEDAELYPDQEFTLDLAGAYGMPKEDVDDIFDDLDDGEWGASVGMNYFFAKFLGIGADAFGLDNRGPLVDNVSGSLILRLPIDVAHLAPYIFGGGGYSFEGPDTWTAHGGAGLELRFNEHFGIFADGRYIWADKSEASDAALFRGGLRFGF